MRHVEFVETTVNNDDDNRTLVEPEKAWQYAVDIDHRGDILCGSRRPVDPASLESTGPFELVPSAILQWKQSSGEFTRSRHELLMLAAEDEVDALMRPIVDADESVRLGARAV